MRGLIVTDNLEPDRGGLVPSGKRELSTVGPDLFRRGLELVDNLERAARAIIFPKDRSVGKLFVTYTVDSPVPHQCTEFLCEAQGNVSVSAGNHLLLEIREHYPSSLSPLVTLKPGDLDALSISNGHVGDHELTYLRGLTKLRELFLIYCWKITDDGLMHLQGLNSLRSVLIEGSRIGDSGLEHLQALPALQDLHLTNTQVTSAGLSILQNFPALKNCKLWYTDLIGDAGLAHLGRLTKLEQLSLTGTKISDAGLSHLRKMTGLQVLSLSETGISDAGLEHLRDLKNLKRLVLSATSVTDVGLSRIKSYLSDCEIVKWKDPES
jgi:Leucine-rich repeat (LRR) protein